MAKERALSLFTLFLSSLKVVIALKNNQNKVTKSIGYMDVFVRMNSDLHFKLFYLGDDGKAQREEKAACTMST